jgi:hypothetical protein
LRRKGVVDEDVDGLVGVELGHVLADLEDEGADSDLGWHEKFPLAALGEVATRV